MDASLARSDARADWKLELRESQRGVIALGSRGASRLVFGEARYVAPTTFIPPPNGVPRIAFEITSTGALEHLELEVPGRGVLVLPGAKFVGTTKVTDGAGKALEIVDTKSDELRGRAVRIELKGKLDQSPQAYEIDTSIETFVRDVARANL